MRPLTENHRLRNRYLRTTVLVTALTISLVACAGTPGAATSPSELWTPTATADPAANTYPVGRTCEDTMSLQALYGFNPNFAYDASKSPASSSHAERIIAIEGISCTYLNLSSGSQIVLALAKLDEAGIATLEKKLSAEGGEKATSISSPIVASFFSVSDGVGTQDILTHEYWISVSSTSFIAPEDTAHFLEPVLASLS